MKAAMSGSVRLSHLRRPNVSMAVLHRRRPVRARPAEERARVKGEHVDTAELLAEVDDRAADERIAQPPHSKELLVLPEEVDRRF
ncbi:hypothetical protein HYQ46_007605 [Verticillium longisporum]|nr:hypothetical protein HYQ46_007605 [Verticillium longisporum]